MAVTWIAFLIPYPASRRNRNPLLTLTIKPPSPAVLSTSHFIPSVACTCHPLA